MIAKLIYTLLLLLLGSEAFAAGETAEAFAPSLTISHLWVLISAVLVFWMQAGFKALESGLVSARHRDGVAVKNLIDCVVGGLIFFGLGYGLMFGQSFVGLVGTSLFGGVGIEQSSPDVVGGMIFFLFQFGFAATATTIVSGAMSGRTGLMPYLISSLITAGIIYPIFGHWVWGNTIYANNGAWLADLGFIDFAGSTVVHSVGAWVSLAGVLLVGPRIGRYNTGNGMKPEKLNYPYALLGVFILWMGWWGFNGGSALIFNDSVGLIILNTNLAACAGALSAFFHAYLVQKKNDLIEKLIGGLLTGLVAITASCHIVTPGSSIIIGILAGVVHNLSFDWLTKRLKIDDAVGAIPVHGFGGVLGTLCVAIFGKAELLPHARLEQLGIQSLGAVACLAFTFSLAWLMFKALQNTVGLRILPSHEVQGIFWEKRLDSTESTKGFSEEAIQIAQTSAQKIEYVSIKKSDTGVNVLSLKDFLEISLTVRQEWMAENRVQYWNADGQLVEKESASTQIGQIIEEERDKIQSEKQHITDSINYARRIQEAMEPAAEYMGTLLKDYFVLNKPRDIVSGDFYWVKEVSPTKVIMAVADCTGHGVPGGFLSMMGIAMLNEIAKADRSPADILNSLRKRFKHALNPNGKEDETKDGMNIALFSIDFATGMLQYAGAYHPLYIFRAASGELEELKADKMPIGVYLKEASFQDVSTILLPGDMIYASTDGYADQPGGPAGRRYMMRHFKTLLTESAMLDCQPQLERLEEALLNWAGNFRQIDDILVVGVRFAGTV